MAPDLPYGESKNIEGIAMELTERLRCQAKRTIRSHQGFVGMECRGTIEGEIDNLGRRLIAVRWDNGLSMYVFPDEIYVDESAEQLFDEQEK